MKGKASAPASKTDMVGVKTELKDDIQRLISAIANLESRMIKSLEVMQARSDAQHDQIMRSLNLAMEKWEDIIRKRNGSAKSASENPGVPALRRAGSPSTSLA
ncbi:MAG: hypothetical protein CO113_03455 [Elusimicrobia bacterium CG_4_9_14_3_um_filter_62_55]|nr:MAG: hypothetical protein COR54_19595 [Elusimicrobia bacterium CG22_combo_CG10-13_8_21_14_all_63_91]PJA13990.1 MAG: hypothetical protein COX66_13735 [Elusimicrobia bacterium CG_4_10_14_0_2_um_filter_63_34]PJB26452.1 MAG: hypothetical protein CO113_03455 [Elusimicrobia bacterium CG_4_9_14_3_um_filter_62_55]